MKCRACVDEQHFFCAGQGDDPIWCYCQYCRDLAAPVPKPGSDPKPDTSLGRHLNAEEERSLGALEDAITRYLGVEKYILPPLGWDEEWGWVDAPGGQDD